MTQDEIIEMAIENTINGLNFNQEGLVHALTAFANLVAAKERENCAKLCDSFQARDVGMQPAECAGAIRARGQA